MNDTMLTLVWGDICDAFYSGRSRSLAYQAHDALYTWCVSSSPPAEYADWLQIGDWLFPSLGLGILNVSEFVDLRGRYPQLGLYEFCQVVCQGGWHNIPASNEAYSESSEGLNLNE